MFFSSLSQVTLHLNAQHLRCICEVEWVCYANPTCVRGKILKIHCHIDSCTPPFQDVEYFANE
jgi:hypothetical protein